ncbi:hypothetical protein PAEVO_48660 [Paenibacillus sp. GM2FR]|nr:hypothetical protein PAEVO_48660 [Paenibacillus sp. GM2FR]
MMWQFLFLGIGKKWDIHAEVKGPRGSIEIYGGAFLNADLWGAVQD